MLIAGDRIRHGILCRPRQAAPTGAGGRRREPSPPAGPGGRPLPRRGLSPIQKGVPTDFLENALFEWAVMPLLPPELTAALLALRHIRSGCTLLHHNGFDDDGPTAARRAETAIRTYLSTGIRLAFARRSGREPAGPGRGGVPRHTAARPASLGGPHGPVRQAAARRGVLRPLRRPLRALQRAGYAGAACAILGPRRHGRFLRRVRARSDALGGVPIHMHLLQTPIQKAYGLRRRGLSTLEWLDGLGLVDRQVVYGHAVHVTARDIALMGRRGTCWRARPTATCTCATG